VGPLDTAVAARYKSREKIGVCSSTWLRCASALGLLCFGCLGTDSPPQPRDASRHSPSEFSSPACLSSAPIDLSINIEHPAAAYYVNDLRLGYARGGVIFLSRPLCELYGWPLCRFVELHEQAHHYMKTVGQKSTCAETLADCWAAIHSDDEAVDAALQYFQGRHDSETGYHADAGTRFEVISHCASLPRRQAARAPSVPGGSG
jgi:hypothetical protein